MTMLVTRPRRSLAMYPGLGMPMTGGAPVDVEETADAFRIELDLPGVAPGDLQIELRDNEIRVSGTFGERRREGRLHHHGRRSGEFEYLVALPGDVNADDVEADLDGGVLTVVAAKAPLQRARRIAVQTRKPKVVESTLTPDTPAAQAKQMKEGQPRHGPAGHHPGSSGSGSTGQVARTSMR